MQIWVRHISSQQVVVIQAKKTVKKEKQLKTRPESKEGRHSIQLRMVELSIFLCCLVFGNLELWDIDFIRNVSNLFTISFSFSLSKYLEIFQAHLAWKSKSDLAWLAFQSYSVWMITTSSSLLSNRAQLIFQVITMLQLWRTYTIWFLLFYKHHTIDTFQLML